MVLLVSLEKNIGRRENVMTGERQLGGGTLPNSKFCRGGGGVGVKGKRRFSVNNYMRKLKKRGLVKDQLLRGKRCCISKCPHVVDFLFVGDRTRS